MDNMTSILVSVIGVHVTAYYRIVCYMSAHTLPYLSLCFCFVNSQSMEGGSNYETLFVFICTGQLSLKDLNRVRREVWAARSKWFNIGLELDLEVSDLNTINRKHNRDADNCLRDCLKLWLRGSHQPPTWSAMVKVLRSPAVGFAEIADEIEEKYIIKRGNTEGKESVISSLQEFINCYLHKPSLSNSYHIIVY